jgi:hypothetical protein
MLNKMTDLSIDNIHPPSLLFALAISFELLDVFILFLVPGMRLGEGFKVMGEVRRKAEE